MLSEDLAADIEFRARFQQEATVVARLSHPNIVNVYDIEPHGHTFCIIMEYIEGESLQAKIDRGALHERDVLLVGSQVARALHYAHAHGVIHRDVKPDNILVTGDNVAKITDFGIARFMESKLKTQTGISMGTPRFMSPEQVTGKSIDGQTDLYSLGVCLYYCLTGKVPFDGENAITIATRHLYEQPTPPSEINTSISHGAEKAVLRALEKSKAARFGTGEEMAEALEAAVGLKRPVVIAAGDGADAGLPAGATRRMASTGGMDAGAETVAGATPVPPTPTGIRRLLQANRERAKFTETARHRPIPVLDDFTYEPPVAPPGPSGALRLVQRYWPAGVAIVLVVAAVAFAVVTNRENSRGVDPVVVQPLETPTSPRVEFDNLSALTRSLISENRAAEALKLWTAFKEQNPAFDAGAVDAKIDLSTAALPPSEVDLLARRRDQKGRRFYQDPRRLLFARAYLEGARDLFAGQKKSYPGEGYLKLLDQNASASLGMIGDPAKAAEAAAQAKQALEGKAGASPEAVEAELMDAIGFAPGNFSYWLDLSEYYRNAGFRDDARVLLRHVESNAPKNSSDYQRATQILRELEK
jgi:hypothetical protein